MGLLERISREKEQLSEENLRLRKELSKKYSFKNIIGNSRKMQEVFYLIAQVAKSNANVLLLGESGTGKELAANAIHYNSLRAQMPLVKVNCAALPANLVEAELFGYEKGAFTPPALNRIHPRLKPWLSAGGVTVIWAVRLRDESFAKTFSTD